MAIIDWPTGPGFDAAQFSLALDVSESVYQGFHTGNRTRASHAADRLRGVLTLPPVRDALAAARREALLLGMRSNGDWLRMGLPHRKGLLGTMRGTPLVRALAAAGSRLLLLQDCAAGSNLIAGRFVYDRSLAAADFTLAACTLGATAELSPTGSSDALVMTKTASGDSRAYHVYTTSTHARRTAIGSVWLKAGTQAGNVAVRIRDGADAVIAEQTFVPSGAWQYCEVVGLVPASPAANLRLDINPTDDGGTTGGTLFFWQPALQVTRALHVNANSAPSTEAPPSGYSTSSHSLTRVATGDDYKTTTVDGIASAGQTYTYSCWLKAGTGTGNVQLYLFNGASVQQGVVTVTPTGAWVRYSVTATFTAGSVGVAGMLNPVNNTGTAGDTLFVFGEMLNAGSAPAEFFESTTLAAGDVVSVGGNLLMVGAAGAWATNAGLMDVPLVTPLQRQVAADTALSLSAPTGLWELDDTGLQLDYSAGNVQRGLAVPLRQVIA